MIFYGNKTRFEIPDEFPEDCSGIINCTDIETGEQFTLDCQDLWTLLQQYPIQDNYGPGRYNGMGEG